MAMDCLTYVAMVTFLFLMSPKVTLGKQCLVEIIYAALDQVGLAVILLQSLGVIYIATILFSKFRVIATQNNLLN